MSHIRSMVAGSMLAIAASSAVVSSVFATQAMAGVPEESRERPAAVVPHDPGAPNYPEYDSRYAVPPVVTVSTDDTTSEAFQAGASALGGAALALAGAWTYRRRHHQLHAA